MVGEAKNGSSFVCVLESQMRLSIVMMTERGIPIEGMVRAGETMAHLLETEKERGKGTEVRVETETAIMTEATIGRENILTAETMIEKETTEMMIPRGERISAINAAVRAISLLCVPHVRAQPKAMLHCATNAAAEATNSPFVPIST